MRIDYETSSFTKLCNGVVLLPGGYMQVSTTIEWEGNRELPRDVRWEVISTITLWKILETRFS